MLNRLRKSPRVALVDDERADGNGILITLKAGWSFDPIQDNRVAGADTCAEAAALVKRARRFAGKLDA